MPKIDYTLPLDQLPDPLRIEPLTKPFDVTITPPGSKSITCRAYVLAALAKGESKIIRPLRADDTDLLLNALCTLGAEARWEGDDVFIKGVNGRFPRGGSVNLGDGGTPTRFMIACACLAAEPVVVDGSPRMRERPIAEGVRMLRQLGAKIEYVEQEGRLPVRVMPTNGLAGGDIRIGETQSSQFISSLVLIAPWLEWGISIVYSARPTSLSYVQLTLTAVGRMGVRSNALHDEDGLLVSHQIASQPYDGRDFEIESDASSALYWGVAAALVPNSTMRLAEVVYEQSLVGHPQVMTMDQPDLGALLMFARGGEVEINKQRFMRLRNIKFREPIHVNAEQMPDGAVALVVASATITGTSKISGLRTLRVKETDRIAALARELRKVGCTVETGDDWITIDPSTRHNDSVIIETYNDHRMAMSLAILGLVRPGLSICNPKCVAKSYPGFWKDFAKLYG